ncbi:MAG: hypothetical protein ACJAVA_001690 [Flavobacteriaceae bacterium]|jgi:hypothetical protein
MDRWLKSQLYDDVKNVIFEKLFFGTHLTQVQAFRDYVNKFFRNKHDSAWRVWRIYAWQKWAISRNLI